MGSQGIAVLPAVLIVDDYRDTTDMYATYLDLAGFRALKAHDGYEALELAAAEMPDVILMDLSLPGIDGFEVTRRLKNDPATCHIPVIALTAHAIAAGQLDDLVAGGFDDLILKPCLPDALASEIHRIIKRAHQERERPAASSAA